MRRPETDAGYLSQISDEEGLDEETGASVLDILLELTRGAGRTLFMATHARGLICLSLTARQVERLGIPMMVSTNTSFPL